MVHCFTNSPISDTVTITGDDVNHIKNVMRMKPGDEILVSSGDGTDVICRLVLLTESEVTAEVLRPADNRELPVQITLIQALPKGDKMETIIQKGTELGITRFVPVESAHCVVKLDEKGKAKKVERWQKIAQSAAEQSQRGIVPEVTPVIRFTEAIKCYANAVREDNGIRAASGCINVFTYECASDSAGLKTLLEACRGRRTAASDTSEGTGDTSETTSPCGEANNLSGTSGVPLREIRMFVGPEGGWSADEAELAKQAGIPWITLGRRILRTETAGIALAAAVMLEIEAGDN